MVLDGKVSLCYIDDDLIISDATRLYNFDIRKNKIEVLSKLPTNPLQKISRFSTYLRRLFRTDITCAIYFDERIYIVRKADLLVYDIKRNTYKNITPKNFKSPLNITSVKSLSGFDDGVYFGDYSSNFEKKEVSIYKATKSSVEKIFSFPRNSINHIHKIVQDNYRDCLWILTGDFGNDTGIYIAKNNFNFIKPIKTGNQDYRSCVAFPTKEGLLYATDSQLIQNSIRLLKFKDKKWISEKIHDINGPSIFGTKSGSNMFFSTSVEPTGLFDNNYSLIKLLSHLLTIKRSSVIRKNKSFIIGGNVTNGFKDIYSFEKDLLPFTLFQFGNIKFPSGENFRTTLCFTTVGLKNGSIKTVTTKNEL